MRINDLALSKEKNRAKRRKYVFVWAMLFLPLLQFAIFFLYVNFSSIILSFQNSMGQFSLINSKNSLPEMSTAVLNIATPLSIPFCWDLMTFCLPLFLRF